MTVPRAPGFYWVRQPDGERAVPAEWREGPGDSPGWYLPGYPGCPWDEKVCSIEVLSERLLEPWP